MLTELRKSIGYIIYERTTSPLWGSFVFSWLICNWKIVFTVFVVGENKLSVNKIDYINQNFINWKPLILYPFISTIILVTIIPLLSNGAYWVTIVYLKWRIDKKNQMEKKTLLSIEQSISIRIANGQLEERYKKLLDDKDTEMETLKLEVEELNKRSLGRNENLLKKIDENIEKEEQEAWRNDFEKLKKSVRYSDFENLLVDIASDRTIEFYITTFDQLAYFSGIELIERAGNVYQLTKKGKIFSKWMNESK